MRVLALLLVIVCAPLAAQDTTYVNTIGMKFTLIQPGTMQVGVYEPSCPDPNAPRPVFGGGARPGAPAGAPATPPRPRPPADPRTVWSSADLTTCAELVKQDAMPGFPVSIKKPYYIGTYEVTQAQFLRVMHTNPSVFQAPKVSDDSTQHPVDSVTWQDAQAFLRKLNALERTHAYRLPTEFEWEYAGRAGGPGQVAWTDIRKQAWEQLGNQPNASTHTVGTKDPNAWGLYDMLGNVWEWVEDCYNDKMFADLTPPKTCTLHVLKGGSFLADVKNTIYATHSAGPGDGFNVGFRIVRDTTPKTK